MRSEILSIRAGPIADYDYSVPATPMRFPSGVGELSDNDLSGVAFGTHNTCPAERLSLLECGLDVGDAYTEEDPSLTAFASADTTVDPLCRVPVNVPIGSSLRNLFRTPSPVWNSQPNSPP